MTWIVPHNQKVNFHHLRHELGLGLAASLLGLDRGPRINYAGTPLTTPFYYYITCNAFAVVVFFYSFLSPILCYSNVWHSAYLPLLPSSTFDNTESSYNVSKVVDENLDFVVSK